jgi:hypothetical protein
VNLPGGLVSGSAAVTLEFWASFGVNADWARVVDFGNISGVNGLNYFFFSPHDGTGGQTAEMRISSTTTFATPGTFDNRTLHVVCIVDPTNHYAAIYTNGVLEATQTGTWASFGSVNSAWTFIGKSLFSADAYLNATIDELRLYDGRLTPDEIAANDKFGPDALALPVTLVQSNSISGMSLSWPSWAVGFVLESSTNPATGDWSPVVPPPSLSGDLWSATIPNTAAAQFFRLRR